MVYDGDYREAVLAAIDTSVPLTAQGADTPGPFVVPTTAKTLTAIRIGLGSLQQDLYVGTTSAILLKGGGITIGEGFFPGPMMAMASAAASSGHVLQTQPMIYKTRIPVTGGSLISAEGFIHGEDPVSAHLAVHLEYDGFPGRIRDCDYREETVGAAANTRTRLGVRGAGVAERDIKPLGTIGEIIFGQIIDPDGDAAASFTIAPELFLSGAGLLVNGEYKFIGAWGGIGPDVDVAGGDLLINPTRYITGPGGIQVKAQGSIRMSAANIESVSESHAIAAFCYV